MKRTPLLLAAVSAIIALTACAPNTGQTIDEQGLNTRSASVPMVRTRALQQMSNVPMNIVLADSGGVTGSDAASSVFATFSVQRSLQGDEAVPGDGYSQSLKIAQDADFDQADVTIEDPNKDGKPEKYTLTIHGYRGSGSASITASAPIAKTQAELLAKTSEDERLRFFRAMDTVDLAFTNAIRAALGAMGIPTPPAAAPILGPPTP